MRYNVQDGRCAVSTKRKDDAMKKLKKMITMLRAAGMLFLYSLQPAHAVSLTFDGQGYPESEPLVIDNGTTFVSLRAITSMRGNAVADFDGNFAHFSLDGLELNAGVDHEHILANGNEIVLGNKVRIIDDRVCVPVRAVAQAMGANVEYDGERKKVTLETKEGYVNEKNTYGSDELFWMSRVIEAESCGEPYIGKLLVGNVVLNRVEDENFPDTIYGVIFDRVNGVQFTPVANGTIYNTPCGECTQAARAVLMGTMLLDEAMYFVNMSLVPVSWVSMNRPVIKKHGSHTFFA